MDRFSLPGQGGTGARLRARVGRLVGAPLAAPGPGRAGTIVISTEGRDLTDRCETASPSSCAFSRWEKESR